MPRKSSKTAAAAAPPAVAALPATAAAPRGRASWSGLLRLSLVAVPVKAYPATSSSDGVHFNQLHADCGQRIAYEKRCPVHGAVEAAEIVKGYPYASGLPTSIFTVAICTSPWRPAKPCTSCRWAFVAGGTAKAAATNAGAKATAARRWVQD